MLEPQKLLDEACAGNPEAKSLLFQYYRRYLRMWADRRRNEGLRAKFDESDVVQETCMQAARTLHQFRGTTEAEFIAWLRRILETTNSSLARDFWNAQKRDIRKERRIDAFEELSSGADLGVLATDDSSPSEHAMRLEREAMLLQAISTLPSDYQEVIVRHGMQEEPIRDIARSLGRTDSGTWKLWARALLALRKIMGNGPQA